MAQNTISIAICFDEHVLHAVYAFLASVEANATRDRPVRIFAITTLQSEDLKTVAKGYQSDHFEVHVIHVDDVYGSLPTRAYITRGTYLRFLLPELLADLDKVLYLDCDIIVQRNLAALYDTDVESRPLAAMPDFSMLLGSLTWPTYFAYDGKTRYRFLAYARTVLGIQRPEDNNYFNCGVLLINLKYWRENNVAAKTLDYLADHPGIYLMDQDALNHVVNGNYAKLDPRWNSFANCSFGWQWNFPVRLVKAGRAWEQIRSFWRSDPWIIHYACADKPWVPEAKATVFDRIWWSYAERSPKWEEIKAAFLKRRAAKKVIRNKIPGACR